MPRRFRPALEPAEARLTPTTWVPGTTPLAYPGWLGSIPDGAVLVADGTQFYQGAQAANVRIIDPLDGTDHGEFTPFPDAFAGEFRAATGDVTGDGATDLVVAPGPGGGPRVRVFDGKTGDTAAEFFAFDPGFRGGVYVAVGDVNRDGHADVVCGAGEGGGPRVRVFDGLTRQVVADFFAFEPGFRGGVRVAVGDVDDDGAPEIITGAGPGGAPRVAVYRLNPVAEVVSFMAYDPALRTGVSVTTAGAGTTFAGATLAIGPEAKVVTAPGAGGGPHVKVFSGTTGQEYFSFVVGDIANRAGLRLTGTQAGVVAETPTPTGPSLVFGPWASNQVYWTLPPGTSLVVGTIASVDTAAGLLTVNNGRTGTSQVLTVSAGTTVTRNGAPAGLGALASGDSVVVRQTLNGDTIDVQALHLVPPPPFPDDSFL